ncbi:hypothetical protein B1C78_07405 [Thioalkalivibrio denitrificans]|uniref:Regulator SirB n=1 Tax=Thioalkalivibrio denitrificans TaxID=108003 RepID=A0A1V3NK64_9GAMM|nr:SirB2 family protein [Thioalkalivibrio denitrificans]OOG25232.1 hypothetical protein B1C78_07405 [Thioalkalivibrio denitrificans]
MYTIIKHLHMLLAILSLAGFMARGVLRLLDSPRLKTRFARVTPHLVDTALLLSGLWLAWIWRMHEHLQPWLVAKLVALVLYIGLGMVAFRFAGTTAGRVVAWLAAITVFIYIFSVARTKLVLPVPV